MRLSVWLPAAVLSLKFAAATEPCYEHVLATYDFGQFSGDFKTAVAPEEGCNILMVTRSSNVRNSRRPQGKYTLILPSCRLLHSVKISQHRFKG
jgi:hypothetical protein